ncbi:cytosolic sulfotransferase 12-like [Andrographis paniculata]|uniref:cytosolic sulfotransferase 12-like n=1 Tax=Andrographis paniculata TaxID=175694 RepID=UPI0021E7827F|nr:cytosolic sulfotransferase 12-like [Andrographis paniculata]
MSTSPISSPPRPKYLQEEEASSQEFKSFISTLPRQKGWVVSNIYQYQGFWYAANHLQGLFSCHKNFNPEDSDIFLVTTPKSGTTWLKALIFTLLNRHRHPVGESHPLCNSSPHDLVPFLEINLYADSQNPNLAFLHTPRLFSSHIPYSCLPEPVRNRCKIVYLCRNPKDTFVSLWHFTNKLRLQEMGANSMSQVFDLFCNGVSLYGPFWDHILEYWQGSKENPESLLFLTFEGLKDRPGFHLRHLAEFLGRPLSSEEEESGLAEEILEFCSFQNLSATEINRNGKLSSGEVNCAFFRRGETGDWKNHLSDEMVQRLDRITEQKFSGSGLVL